ncbi:MAG: type II toxin-antitoxin system RelE/ParE family toxin [Candidatus Dormibacteria bacterium]
MRVVRDKAFTRDRERQAEWLMEQGRRTDLQRLQVRVKEALGQLARFPALGYDDEGDGVRELSLHPLPFLVWYQVVESGEVVRVIALFHERQDRMGRR